MKTKKLDSRIRGNDNKRVILDESGSRKPFVTVIIPVFNGAQYLEEAVTSIQKSTYTQFEIILVNDGSTDKSKHLCMELNERYSNVRFFDFAKNKGLGRVLNFALKQARGSYICRLNQDDRMLPNRMAIQVNYLEKHPDVTVVGSSIVLFDNEGNKQIVHYLLNDEDIKKMWYIVSPFSDPTVMYRKQTAIDVGGYYQEFWPADDTQLWYRMGTKGKLANIPTPLAQVRWHTGAASYKFFRKLALSTYKMHEWTHKNIEPAAWYIRLFWVIQFIAGYTLSPEINWGVYRVMKKMIAKYEAWKTNASSERVTQFLWRLAKITPKASTPRVTPQPKKLSFSGV